METKFDTKNKLKSNVEGSYLITKQILNENVITLRKEK